MKKLIFAISITIASLGHCYDLGIDELVDLVSGFENRSDGAELSVHEFDTSQIPDAGPDVIGLTFEVKSDKPKRYYRFRQYNLAGRKNFDYVVSLREGVVFQATGGLIVDVLHSSGEGEPFFYFLESLDGEQRAFARLLPRPRMESSGNKRLTVSAMDFVPSSFVVETHGYPSGGEVYFSVQGDAEIIDSSPTVDETGRAYIAVRTKDFPPEGGLLSVTVFQDEHELTISWPVGDLFFDPDGRLKERLTSG